MIPINNLHFIWYAVSAYLSLFEQVYVLWLGCHMEEPYLIVELLSEAADWLVCFCKLQNQSKHKEAMSH